MTVTRFLHGMVTRNSKFDVLKGIPACGRILATPTPP
jgi:hypothetical protein